MGQTQTRAIDAEGTNERGRTTRRIHPPGAAHCQDWRQEPMSTITVTNTDGAPVVMIDGVPVDLAPVQAAAIYEAVTCLVRLAVDAPGARPLRVLEAE